MTRKLTKFAIFTIAILSAELLVKYLLTYLPDVKDAHSPYLSVLAGMGVTVLIFYPAYSITRAITRTVSKKYLKVSKKLASSRLKGILTGSVIAFGLLFIGYARIWYNLRPLRDLKIWVMNLV